MKYILRYDDIDVANITGQDSDFPTFYGIYGLIKGIECNPKAKKVLDYIQFNIKTWPLIEANRIGDNYYSEESRYADLIESRKWSLVAANNEVVSILAPVFTADHGINWRLG